MASSAVLLYQSQQEVDGHTFYQLRLDLVPEVYEVLIDLLVFIIGESLPDELSVLSLPFLLPSAIASGTQLAYYTSTGLYTLPETIYFAYAKGNPHIHAVYDVDEPDASDIAIAQAFLAETEVWYCDIAPGSIEEWPSGDDPTTNNPESNGWNYPDSIGDWGWQELADIAARYLGPFYYTEVWLKNLIVWAGCSDWEEDEDHFLNNSPSQYLGNRFRFTDPNFIYSCNEEEPGFLYWVERETIGSVESLSLWKFQADTLAYYYPHLDFSDVQPIVSPVQLTLPTLDLINLLDIDMPAIKGGIYIMTQLANLYAGEQYYGVSSGNKGVSSGNKGVAS